MSTADADPTLVSRTAQDIDRASFEAGVAACRAALIKDFGSEAGFTGRLMRIIDSVEPSPTMSRTFKVRPNPPIIPLSGEVNG